MLIEIFLGLQFVTFLIFANPPAEDTLYVARILVTRPKAEFQQQLCSGSLMLKAWVLTSAFCVRNAWVSRKKKLKVPIKKIPGSMID